jgi:uncharacterized protein (TIGR03435 family)
MRPRVLTSAVLLFTAMCGASRLYGQAGQTQSQPRPVTFEVASVKADTTDTPTTSRFPLGPGDAYVPGSLFSATNVPLINYIRFAFGRSQGEMLHAPSWVYNERFDIQGRAKGESTKTDMRLLVRALLVERFKLAWHTEQHEGAVLALTVATPGRLGPEIALHRQGEPCGQDPKFADIPCGSAGLVAASRPDRTRVAGRAEPIERLAAFLSNNGFSGVDRAVIDRTGLDGQFDFSLEFAIPVASAETQPTVDVSGPSLATALREQLGLKLESTRGPVDVLVIDRVERPTSD